MVIDTGRGNNAAQVGELREELELLPDDELVWLGFHLPKEPLPVARHLVVGPTLRHLAAARQCETAFATSPADDVHRSDMSDDAATEGASELPEEQLDEQLPETSWVHHEDEDGDEQAVSPAPTRERGVAYLVKGTRNVLRRRWRPLKTRLVTSDNRAVQTLVGGARALYPGADDRFGVAASRSRSVLEMAHGCEVVLAHDRRSIVAAWLIGRRVPDPDLVVGVPAARRVIAGRRRPDAA